MKKIFLGIACLCVCMDRIGKILVETYIGYETSISIIPHFFYLTYVKNEGAAWNLLSGNRIFLILIAIIALLGIYYYLKKSQSTSSDIILGVLYGGIIGNLLDRILYGHVIDYLGFYIFGYAFPIFNFADICIVVSVFLIIVKEWSCEKNEKI